MSIVYDFDRIIKRGNKLVKYIELKNELDLIDYESLKTKDVENVAKRLIKNKEDVSDLSTHCLKDQRVHRIYFEVSLYFLLAEDEQFNFIENNFNLLNDWWHVDQLTIFTKPFSFDFAFKKAKSYINNSNPFVRRLAYVIFLPDLIKDTSKYDEIATLFKNDDEYYVQMGLAWLISYMAIYDSTWTYNYLNTTKLKYNITSKAIQKTCDSFRVSQETKTKFKSLREKLKTI